MKISPFFFCLLGCLLLWNACEEPQDQIVGHWERFDDRAAGSILQLTRIGNEYQGRIVGTVGEMKDFGFIIGDIKWRNVVYKADNYYEAEDLGKAIDGKSGAIRQVYYTPVYIELVTVNLLQLSSFAKGIEEVGTHQKWRRVKGDRH